MASSSSSGRRLDGTLTLRTGAASLIPGLPDDVAAVILCLLTFPDQSRLRATSRAWRLLLSAAALLPLRRSLRLPRRHLLCLFPTDPSLASPILLDPAAPTAWWPLPPIPCSPQLYGLANFAAIAVGRHLYVLGGSRFDARSYPLGHPSPSAAAYRLDLSLSRHRWERLPDMRFPRGSFACAPEPSGGVIVAGGGSRHPTFPSYGSRTSGTEWYDTAARAWRVAAVMPRERAGCVGFIVHGAGDGMEDEFWVMGGYDGYTTVGGVVPNDVYCRDAVALGLWSGKWREIGNMWEEGERRRLGPVAAISAEDGRVPEVFMLDGHDVFRDQLHRDVSVDRDLIDIFARGIDHDEVLLLAVKASRAENQDAIDAAMVGMLADPKEARADIKVVHFLPFKRTALTYVDLADGTWHRTSKGVPEQILALCNCREDDKNKVHAVINKFADRGRSLAVARQEVPEKSKHSPGGPWEFVGLLPLLDPPKHDSAETIRRELSLGVNVKMITGDQLAIIKETGRRLGMGSNMYPSSAMLGQNKDETIASVPVDDLIEKADGFAGVFPEHKYDIVKKLQEMRHICGVTGDDAYDTSALKKADIGIAVVDATDAARSASDIVLTEPGLSVIISAMLTSRAIFQRMKNYTIYAVSITIRIVLGFMLIALIWKFDFSPFIIAASGQGGCYSYPLIGPCLTFLYISCLR